LKDDIVYTMTGNQAVFRANTPKGQNFLKGLERTVSDIEAEMLIEEARKAGLEVKSFFDGTITHANS
jgi:hypothetical protein